MISAACVRFMFGKTSLALVYIFVLLATYYCFDKYFTLKETHPNDGDIEFTISFQYYIDLYQTWLVLGACC